MAYYRTGNGGSGGKGIHIELTCDSAYQGYNIICTTGSISKTKICGINNKVDFYFSENEINTLPVTFIITNNLHSTTINITANMYGWYENELPELIPLVPKMTNFTTPYGQAGASATYQNYYAWHVFDKTNNTWVCQGFASGVSKVWYKFRNPTCIKKVLIGAMNVNAKTFKIQASNDGVNWIDLFTGESHSDTEDEYYEFNNNNYYLYYAYTGLTQKQSGQFQLDELQFYGYEE